MCNVRIYHLFLKECMDQMYSGQIENYNISVDS